MGIQNQGDSGFDDSERQVPLASYSHRRLGLEFCRAAVVGASGAQGSFQEARDE